LKLIGLVHEPGQQPIAVGEDGKLWRLTGSDSAGRCWIEVEVDPPAPPQPARKVHAVYPGNLKETVCEHDFTMFDRDSETWDVIGGERLITCRTCREILHLPPLPPL
jgi:hypothetical protein